VRLSVEEIAAAIGAEVVAEGESGSPRRAVINSAEAGPGDLFFGLKGANHDGAMFAPAALEAGAWGAVVSPDWRWCIIGVLPIKCVTPLSVMTR
jgi:UDP-N-acetylmuramyl pentapeptide synthase